MIKNDKRIISINRLVKWDEVKENYPDCWAFIDPKSIKKKDGFIDSCYVFLICTFEEKGKQVIDFRNKNLEFDCIRTTFSAPTAGVLF